MNRFDQLLFDAESIVRDCNAEYDRNIIEGRIAALDNIEPGNARYREARIAIQRYNDNLLTLRLSQSFQTVLDALRIASELTDGALDLHDRLRVVEGALRLAGACPGKPIAELPSMLAAPLPEDSHIANPTL